jgi:cell division protein FtsB
MKRVLTILLLLVVGALSWQLYQLYRQSKVLNETLGEVENKVMMFNEENLQFQADLEYFSNPENLEKELRGRFNYKKPDEKLIILVPAKNDN